LVAGRREVNAIADDVGKCSLAGGGNTHKDHGAVRVAFKAIGSDGGGGGFNPDYFPEGISDAANVDLAVGVNERFAVLSGGGMRKAHEVMLGVERFVRSPACIQESMGSVCGPDPLLYAREVHERPLVPRANSVDNNTSREHCNRNREGVNRGANAFEGSWDSLQRDGDKHSVAEVLCLENLNKGTGACSGKVNGE